MFRRFIQLLVVLVPLGGFAWALQPVQQRLYGGHATEGIVLLVVALVVLAVLEGLLFRYWILPGWGDKMAERLYAGSYLPEQDALAQLASRIEIEKDASLIPQLEIMVRRQSWRLRGWLELARLQVELQHDASAALFTLESALKYMRDPEDAALLMYRASQISDKVLHDADAARARLQQLVERYPATVYGRRAVKALQ